MSFFKVHVTRKSCQNDVSYEKFARNMLMKLTGGGNVIRIYLKKELTNFKFNVGV
jgi:hypothetical protein